MCFYADADWCAEVNDSAETTAVKDIRCDECRKTIPAGQYVFTVSQQEHEECQSYENGTTYGDDDEEIHDHECDKDPDQCDFGETFDYACCRSCKTLREAIRKVEESEGCTGSEAEPSYPSLFYDVSEGQGWEHYAEKFKELGLTEALALVPAGA